VPLLALLFIFIAVPLAELYVILRVGDAIGWEWTILILAADSLLGTLLLKSQGRAVWKRFNDAMREGRVPHSEVIDGVLVIFGGAFLITPGFLTDIIGVLLLLPPTRRVFRSMARRAIERRTVVAVGGAAAGAARGRRRRPPPEDAGGYDVEGTATEVDSDTRHLRR
jgi:UPF0716 protein FxsA